MENIEELIDKLDSQEKEKTRNEYLRFIRKWPWFTLSVLITMAIAIYLYKATPETYQVNSRLLIFSEDNKVSSELNFDEPRYTERSNISDQVGILRSFSVFNKTIENLGWKTSWYKKGLFSSTELYKDEPFDVITQDDAKNIKGVPLQITSLNDQEYLISVDKEAMINGVKTKIHFKKKAYFNKPFKNEFFHFSLSNRKGNSGEKYILVFNSPTALTSLYQKKVEISANAKESELVIVSAKGENPQKETDFLNELNKVFIEFGMEKKSLNSENSVSFIENQAEEVRETLRQSEEKLNNYKQAHSTLNLGQEANVIYSTISDIENKKFQAEQLLEYYQNLKKSINNAESIGQVSTPVFLDDANNGLNEMVTQLKDLYTRREVLKMSVKEESQIYQRLQKEIDLTRSNIASNLDNLIQNAQRDKQNIDTRYRNVQSRLSTLPETEKNLISMQRDFDVNNELYNFLLKKKAEASISQASIAPQAKVIDPAMSEYAERLGPNLMIYIFAGIFLGLIIPFLIIMLTGFFNNKIESVSEVEEKSGVTVLDEIIHHKYKQNLPVLSHPRSGITESFRNLKVKVLHKMTEPHQKVISLNSLVSGEGKTFISANFATTLSFSNKKVLLVGTDLRNPQLHAFMGGDQASGLSSFLQNQAEFDEIIKQSPAENLFFVQAGHIPENPAELLENGRFEEFIRIARERFDYIVLDNAPMMLVPDANWTSRFSDISLFILRLNYSRKKEIQDVNKIIRLSELKNAFLIVNDTPQKGYGYGSRYWKNGYGKYNKKMKIA